MEKIIRVNVDLVKYGIFLIYNISIFFTVVNFEVNFQVCSTRSKSLSPETGNYKPLHNVKRGSLKLKYFLLSIFLLFLSLRVVR